MQKLKYKLLMLLISMMLLLSTIVYSSNIGNELPTPEFRQKVRREQMGKILQEPLGALDNLGRWIDRQVRRVKTSGELAAGNLFLKEWERTVMEALRKVKRIAGESGLLGKILFWGKALIRSAIENFINQLKALPHQFRLLQKLFIKPPEALPPPEEV